MPQHASFSSEVETILLPTWEYFIRANKFTSTKFPFATSSFQASRGCWGLSSLEFKNLWAYLLFSSGSLFWSVMILSSQSHSVSISNPLLQPLTFYWNIHTTQAASHPLLPVLLISGEIPPTFSHSRVSLFYSDKENPFLFPLLWTLSVKERTFTSLLSFL